MAPKNAFIRTAFLDGNALTNQDSFDLMPIKMFLPRFIPMQMCFESQFCQSCPDVSFLHCQLPCSTVFTDNVWCIFSFPCHKQLLSHFISRKGASSAPPLLNCALLRNAIHPFTTWMAMLYRSSFFTCSKCIYLFFTLKFCHLFPDSQHPTLSLFSTVFSLFDDFFHKHKWGFNKPIQHNYHLIWG